MARYADNFVGWVELHEHTWNKDQYVHRPHLDEILNSPVVTFWRGAKKEKVQRYYIKLYPDLKELEAYFTRLVLRANIELPQEKLVRIYVDRKQVIISGVRMQFREVKPGP